MTSHTALDGNMSTSSTAAGTPLSSPSRESLPKAETNLEKGADAPSPSSASQLSHEEASPRSVHGWRWFLVCASIYLAAFTYGLDTTIAADVQSAVVETFGTVSQVSWLGAGFLLGSVSTILPIGNLYERFDIKYNFLAGVVLFEVGSAICGAAPHMSALIVGRVIAGVGGSGVYLGGLSYFTSLTSERERGAYISAMGIFWGVGCVVGPVIGGAFSESSATWRWAFYINLVIAALCAPVYLTLPSYTPASELTPLQRLRSMDWLGVVLYAGAWAVFTVLFTFGGNTWAWNSGPAIALFTLLGLLLLGFFFQQFFALATSTTNRLFPAHLLRSRSQVLLAAGTSAATSALFLPIYYLPLYFQFVHGDTAISAAIRLLPFLVISMGINLLCGVFLPRVPHYAALYLASGVFVVAGAAPLFALLSISISPATIYGLSILIALGAGTVIQAGYTVATVKVFHHGHAEDVPAAIALQNVAQIGGGALSLIIAGQVFQSAAVERLTAVLAPLGFGPEAIRSAVAGAQSGVLESLDAANAARATEALTAAMDLVWVLPIVAGAVLVVVGGAMRWERLF